MLDPVTTAGRTRRLKFWLLLAYLGVLHLLAAALLLRTDFLQNLTARFLPEWLSVNPHGQRMLAYHLAMDASVPDGAAIFLGDSLTQGLATAAVAPYSVNYGIGAATTIELLDNLPRYQSLHRAGGIFLLIGINDILHGKTVGLEQRLATIAATLPHDKVLIWSGIMPVYSGKIAPATIASANDTIKKLCAQRQGCSFLDTHAIINSAALLLSDGLHLNARGYAGWIEALRRSYAQTRVQARAQNMLQDHAGAGAE